MTTKTIALCGLGSVRGSGFKPLLKTPNGWQRWADTEARKLSRRDKFHWTGIVSETSNGQLRISFAGDKRK